MRLPRRAQAMVEVLALAPLVVAATLAYAVAAEQLATIAEAEAALARAVAIDAAGASVERSLPHGARLERMTSTTITIAVSAPLREISLTGERAR